MAASLSYTSSEIIELIKRSNERDKTWVLLEDQTKYKKQSKEPFRFIQKQLGSNYILLPCFGKENLMGVFARKNEIADKHIVFFRDRDFYVHSIIPTEYNEIIFTTGYSIENDLVAHTTIEADILEDHEIENFSTAKSSFIKWYAYSAYCHINNIERNNYDSSAFNVLCDQYNIKPGFILDESILANSQPLYADILENYLLKLRGHSLFSLFVLFTNSNSRLVKYNYNSLTEYSINNLHPPLLMRTLNEIELRRNTYYGL